jgi:hypothetical protein
LDRRQNLAARRIGGNVADDQLHSFADKEVAGCSGAGRGVHQTCVNYIAKLIEVTIDDALVALQPALQAFELRPVCGQANAEQPDLPSVGLGFQTTSR